MSSAVASTSSHRISDEAITAIHNVHSALSPRIAILSSPDVQTVLEANHLNDFADLLKPFEDSVENRESLIVFESGFPIISLRSQFSPKSLCGLHNWKAENAKPFLFPLTALTHSLLNPLQLPPAHYSLQQILYPKMMHTLKVMEFPKRALLQDIRDQNSCWTK